VVVVLFKAEYRLHESFDYRRERDKKQKNLKKLLIIVRIYLS